MQLWRDESRSLPDWIAEAYEILLGDVEEHQEGIARERAEELLHAHESFPDEPADAEHAIDFLLNNGWLYEVEDELRITESDHLEGG